MRKVVHFVLIGIIGAAAWLVAYWAGVAVFALTWLADKVLPEADCGNCWSYAMPRWAGHRPTLPENADVQRGGLMLQFVETARFWKIFPVVHCVWLPDGPGRTPMETTKPVERHRYRWLPLAPFYFHYNVLCVKRHTGETRPAPLGD